MTDLRLKFLKALMYSVITVAVLYGIFLYVMPVILNSAPVINKSKEIIGSKTGTTLVTDNMLFETYPNLTIKLSARKIILTNKQKEDLLTLKDILLTYDVKKLRFEELYGDYIYVNETGLKDIISKNSNKKPADFKLSFIPLINISRAEIWIDKNGINSIFIMLYDINISKQKEAETYCTFNADIISPLLQNILHIGNSGYLYISDNGLYAKDLELSFGMPKLKINGKIIDNQKLSDCTFKGENLPVSDIEQSLLYFLKLRKKGKQFIENFYNFSGGINVDLHLLNKGLYGKCVADNLFAKTVLFDVPVFFKEVTFDFENGKVTSSAQGTLGGEKIYNDFILTGMATDKQEVSGTIKSSLSDAVADKYIPDLTITGNADTKVTYKVKNKIIYVDYLLNLKKNSDLLYKTASSGQQDKDRRVLVNTIKYPEKLEITHFDYSHLENGIFERILTGSGLFVKKSQHLTPEYISVKTAGFAPVSITGSFGKNIEGGMFDGDLTYNFNTGIITGDFLLKDTKYKNFYVNEATVKADKQKTSITAAGTFRNSHFYTSLTAKSNFRDEIYIYEMLLDLKEYVITKGKKISNNNKQIAEKIKNEVKELDLTIEKWTVKIEKIQKDRIKLLNVILTGSVKNHIFTFVMPGIKFADGILSADGYINLKNKSAEADLSAKKINSDKVATVIFNFPGQIEGIADANIKITTSDGFKNFKAYTDFSVKNGLLPKLGSTEFIIKKSKKSNHEFKFKLSDLVNIDIKNMKALCSDLDGSFWFDNYTVKDAKITSRQKYLSLYLEGDYNIEDQYANLELFGKYNEMAVNKVKILFVPLSFIVKIIFKQEHTFEVYKNKLECIPKITASKNEEKAFRVKINGNLYKKDAKVELKSII